MPRINIPAISRSIEASPAISVLNTLVKEGILIAHVCGGKAECGTCRIRLLSGNQGVNPIEKREKERLIAVKAKPDERLACQTYCYKDISIEIVSFLKK